MNRLRFGRLPSKRGSYLFVWGFVYGTLAILMFISPQRNEELIFVGSFGIASVVSIVSSFYHRIDNLGFALLAGVATLRGLWSLFVYDIHWLNRFSVVSVWLGVGIAQMVVARWPAAVKDHLEKAYTTGEMNATKAILRSESFKRQNDSGA